MNFKKSFLILFCCALGLSSYGQSKTDSLFATYNDQSIALDIRLKALSRFVFRIKNNHVDSALKLNKKGLEMAKEASNYYYLAVLGQIQGDINAYQKQDFLKADELYKKALEQSKRIDGSNIETGCYKGLADINMYQGNMKEAKGFYDKAISATKGLDEPTRTNELASIYVSMGNYYANNNQFQKAIDIVRKAHVIYRQQKSSNKNIALGNIGSFHNRLGNYDSAIWYYQQIPRDGKNITSEAINDYNIAIIYQNTGKSDSAIFYYKRAYDVFEATDNKRGQSGSLHGIGIEFGSRGENKKALEYFDKAIAICKETNNKGSLFSNYRMKGETYVSMSSWDMAREFYDMARELGKEMKNSTHMAMSFMDLGNLQMAENKWQQSITHWDSAIHYFTLSEEKKFQIDCRNSKAKCLLELDKPQEVLNSLRTNIPMVSGKNLKSTQSTYHLLSKAFDQVHQSDSAYKYLTLANAVRDSLDAKTDDELSAKIRTEFAVELNQKDKELAEAKVSRERSMKHFGFGLLGLALASIFLIISRHRKYKKEKDESTRLKMIAAQQTLEHSQEILQNQSNLILEKNRIIGELKENMNAFFGSDAKASEHFDSLLENKILTNQDWDNFKRSFGLLHPNFMGKVYNKFGSVTEAELRLLCLKKLGLNREEIADMVGVLPESIKKGFNRFKKKHNIEGLLSDILKSIE